LAISSPIESDATTKKMVNTTVFRMSMRNRLFAKDGHVIGHADAGVVGTERVPLDGGDVAVQKMSPYTKTATARIDGAITSKEMTRSRLILMVRQGS